MRPTKPTRPRLLSMLRRSLREFLLLPFAVVAGFIALTVVTDLLDHMQGGVIGALRDAITKHVFGSPDRTSDVLSAVATGIVTMTSITISVLLVALQQSSTNLTAQVFDQFVRRRRNQVFFGCFIGLAVYALIILATVNTKFTPVFGSVVALVLTVGALSGMIGLLYEVVNEMRPVEIVTVIHDHALRGRERQRALVARTRRRAQLTSVPSEVRMTMSGFVKDVDVDALARVAERVRGEVELVVSVGAAVAMNDVVANVRGDGADADSVADAVRAAIEIGRQREIDRDPAFALDQLEAIGWSTISSAKHSREAGLLCIQKLFDLLARWADTVPPEADGVVAVVYPDDVAEELFNAIEALAMVTRESLQSACFVEVLRGVTRTYDRLPRAHRVRMDDLLSRALTHAGDLPPTHALDKSLDRVAHVLFAFGSADLGLAVEHAREALDREVHGAAPATGRA